MIFRAYIPTTTMDSTYIIWVFVVGMGGGGYIGWEKGGWKGWGKEGRGYSVIYTPAIYSVSTGCDISMLGRGLLTLLIACMLRLI